MTDLNKTEQEPRSGLSDLTVKLERLIDGDVTCWGIDDVIAYGLKVVAMERERGGNMCVQKAHHELHYLRKQSAMVASELSREISAL